MYTDSIGWFWTAENWFPWCWDSDDAEWFYAY